jgi:hypothetical protein
MHQNERAEWAAGVRALTGRRKQRLWEPATELLNPPPLLNDVAVVLVNPKRPVSIGAVARACSCFEVEDLRIVDPRCDHLARSARNGSKGAQYLLWKASLYPDLATAQEDVAMSVAFTRWIKGECTGGWVLVCV